ncbi:MAG: hypothetical protein GX750_00945 [Clostridia bacterium]|nr:hypothetical protein [Clostridia bacterium]
MPIFESPEAAEALAEGHRVRVDADTGVITNLTTGETYRAKPFPEFMQQLIEAGGLMAYVKEKVSNGG